MGQPNGNVLKPSNHMGSSSFGLAINPFTDGSHMGPLSFDKELGSVQFHAIGPTLYPKRNVAIKFMAKSKELIVETLQFDGIMGNNMMSTDRPRTYSHLV